MKSELDFCDRCFSDVPEVSLTYVGFTGPSGEWHDYWLCEECVKLREQGMLDELYRSEP